MIRLGLWSSVKSTVNAYLIAIEGTHVRYPNHNRGSLSLSTVAIEVRSNHVRDASNGIGRVSKLLEFGYHTCYLVQGGTAIIPNRTQKLSIQHSTSQNRRDHCLTTLDATAHTELELSYKEIKSRGSTQNTTRISENKARSIHEGNVKWRAYGGRKLMESEVGSTYQ